MAYGLSTTFKKPQTPAAPATGTTSAVAPVGGKSFDYVNQPSAVQGLSGLLHGSSGSASSSAPSYNAVPQVNGLVMHTPQNVQMLQAMDPRAAMGPVNEGPLNGGPGSYGGLLGEILGQIRGYDPTSAINHAYDLQNAEALKAVGLQAEAQQASRGLAPGDPAGRSLQAELTAKALSPLAADRAMALANAGQSRLQMQASLLPGLQAAEQAAQAERWRQLQWQQAQQDRLQQQQDDALRRQWALEDRRFQVDQRKGLQPLVANSQPSVARMAYSGPQAVAAPQAQAASRGPVNGGFAPPINAPGSPGSYNFWDGFGQSFYGPLGRGGAENAIDAQTRRAEIASAGNGYGPVGPVNGGMSSAVNGALSGFSGAPARARGPVTYTPDGATAAPVAGGAQLVYAPAMSGISVAGPMTSDPMAQGATPYGTWSSGQDNPYGLATLAALMGGDQFSPYAFATGRA